jgi:transposase
MQLILPARIFVGLEPLDFRNGLNGTAAACRLKIKQNPLDGGLFVFINRSKNMLRLYYFDGHGECAFTKRVVKGRFPWWNDGKIPEEVVVEHLHLILRGGDPKKIKFPEPWKKLT